MKSGDRADRVSPPRDSNKAAKLGSLIHSRTPGILGRSVLRAERERRQAHLLTTVGVVDKSVVDLRLDPATHQKNSDKQAQGPSIAATPLAKDTNRCGCCDNTHGGLSLADEWHAPAK